MKHYQYKFVNVPAKGGFKVKAGDTFNKCKDIINSEASKGWRLKQVVVPFNEKTGVYGTNCYEVIFEKEVKCSRWNQIVIKYSKRTSERGSSYYI